MLFLLYISQTSQAYAWLEKSSIYGSSFLSKFLTIDLSIAPTSDFLIGQST